MSHDFSGYGNLCFSFSPGKKKSKSGCDVIFAAISTKQHVLYVWEM